jgi:transcriptional regulator with XRE-family HTH domain
MSGDEMRKILSDNNIKLKELAETLNISPQTLNSRLNAKEMKLETIKDIAKSINKSLDFFLRFENTAREITNIEFLQIPFVPIHAQAGYGRGYGDHEYIDSLPTIPVIVDKNYKGKYRVFETEGDSMDDGSRNALYSGDKILGREVKRELWKNKLHIKDWFFVVCMKNDGITVKKITSHNVEDGKIVCHSLNYDKISYPDFEVNLEDVAELYNVIKIVDRNTRI